MRRSVGRKGGGSRERGLVEGDPGREERWKEKEGKEWGEGEKVRGKGGGRNPKSV